MIWCICFAVAALILWAVVHLALARNLGKLRFLAVVGGCAASAFVMYIPPYFLQYSFSTALFGNLINMLQIISLDADYLAHYDFAGTLIQSEPWLNVYFFGIAVIHFLLPAVFAMTAITLIMQCLTQLRISGLKRRKRTLHVFSHVNARSEMLARDIRSNDKRCDIVFLTSGDDRDYSDLRSDLRCSVLDEKIENVEADARRRKVYYYCISDDEECNLNSTLALMNLLEGRSPEFQQNTHVFLFSSDPDAELLMDSLPKGLVNLFIVDEEMVAVYRLLEEHPLFHTAKDGLISVLITGFTPVAQATLRSVAWIGQVAGFRLEINLFAKDAQQQIEDFKELYPRLFAPPYDIRCYSYSSEKEFRRLVREEGKRATYVIVCDDEKDMVEKSVLLRRMLYTVDGTYTNAPPIYAYVENPEKADAVASLCTAEANNKKKMSYGIVPFGMTTQLYTFKGLSESKLESLAKNVHMVYSDIFSDTDVNVVEALREYNRFEVNKKSNRANALHIRYKLGILGLDYTDDPDAEEVDFAAYLTPERMEHLMRVEHDRWQAFLESEGWETATVEQSKAYQASGISRGRHQCPLLRVHPYICPFDELQDRSAALNLPDSTVYDRELIARIPDILHDKWGVAGKKYKIVKRQEN